MTPQDGTLRPVMVFLAPGSAEYRDLTVAALALHGLMDPRPMESTGAISGFVAPEREAELAMVQGVLSVERFRGAQATSPELH